MRAIGRKYTPLCFVEDKLLAYRREKLYLIDVSDYSAAFLCNLKIKDPRRPMCFCTFGERLAHISVYCGIEVENGAVIAFNRGIYFVDVVNKCVIREHDFTLPDMRRPLNFYKIEGLTGFEDMVVYSDYAYNAERRPIRIWRRAGVGKWEELYTFPEGAIRHVHSIICDPYRNRVIVLTGDFGDECAIWEAKDNFSQMTQIMGGEQKYRACAARAYPEGIVIVTDSPFDQNYAYIVKEKENGEISVEELAKLPGPTVFFAYYKDDIVFETDVEYDEVKVQGFKKYFSYVRAEGVQDWCAHMFIGNPKGGFKEIIKMKKDIFPMVSLGFGQFIFPNGETHGKVFFSPRALKKYDGKLCVMKEEKGEWRFEDR